MTSFSPKRALAFSLPLLALLSAADVAHAQRTAQDIASARQLYNEGIELRDKNGDVKGALEKFKGAHALGNTPITGLELCKTYQTLKQPVDAREACLSVGRIGPIPEESQRSKDSRVEAAKIAEVEKPKMSSIKVKVTGVPAGFEPSVAIDGVAIPPAALAAARPVNPGAHVVTAKVGSGPESKANVETKEGDAKDVEIAVEPPPKDEKPVPVANNGQQPVPTAKEGMSPTAKLLFGVGGVAATIGLVGGLVVLTKKGDLEDNCAKKICGTADHDTLDSAETWGTVSTIAFVGAGIALAAGLVIHLTSSSKTGSTTSRPTVGFTARGLGGTF